MQLMAGHKYIFFFLLLILTALACTETSPVAHVNATPEGVAIKGFDPVAYFTEQKPVMGSAGFEYVWNGAKWRFATAEHRDLFRAAPEKYAPRYGGYCAYAVSQGKTADIDPEAWTVFDGKLYLNLNKDVQGLWDKNREEYIRKADGNWPRMLGKKRHQ
jgi:YHS domain-containing protein